MYARPFHVASRCLGVLACPPGFFLLVCIASCCSDPKFIGSFISGVQFASDLVLSVYFSKRADVPALTRALPSAAEDETCPSV